MDPIPPKASRSRKFVNRPFYESSKKTSAEIISEARSTVRALNTKRPETPVDSSKRSLFGKQKEGRPPSAVSVSSSYYESRPPTGKTRLTPLNNVPDFAELESKLEQRFTDQNQNFKVSDKNANDNNNTTQKKSKLKIKDNIIPKSAEPSFSKLRKSRDLKKHSASKTTTDERRVQSGPKERTLPVFGDESLDDLLRSNSYSDLTSIEQLEEKERKEEPNQNIKIENSEDYYTSNVEPLVKQMELNYLHEDTDALLVNFEMLWKTLEIGNMLGKSSQLSSKRRSELLSTVYKCIWNDSPLLVLKLCKLFLAMEVTGKNLGGALKLMFQVGREKNNDEIFIQEKLIEPLLKYLYNPEKHNIMDSLVYLAGTIKFLTLSEACLQEMLRSDGLKAIASLLQFTKDKMSDDAQRNKESCHVLVQISSALSNFADVTTLNEQFIDNNILQLLLDLMKTRFHDSEYVMNVSRIFSKLTVSEKVCKHITSTESNTGILMNALLLHMKKQEVAVRMCFAFGNMANHVAEFRHQVVFSCDGVKVLVKVAIHYLKDINKIRKSEKKGDCCKEEEDVLVKVVRVIANLCIMEECGVVFSDTEEWIRTLLAILENREELQLSSELIVNTAATVNNMSFFAKSDSSLVRSTDVFTNAFLQMLLSDNNDCQMEAMRTLGNFTQTENARRILLNKKGMEVIIILLDSCDIDMVFCTCGVLVNMMVDQSTRVLFKELKGVSKLVELLKSAGESDWALAGLISQIMWNYTEQMTSTVQFFNEMDSDDVITTLNDFIDPEVALPSGKEDEEYDEDTMEYLRESWMEFLPIGQSLLERMERCHSNLEPIVTPPD